MEKNFETKHVYRVWFGHAEDTQEAFFTNKADAQAFASLVRGIVNNWQWEMKIEE